MTLHATINSLAAQFAHQLLAALRHASLEEIISETAGGHHPAARRGRPAKAHAPAAAHHKGGKRVRRSAEEIEKTIAKITAALKGHKNGLSSEQLQKVLHLKKKDITGPITHALAGKKIKKRGERRGTTYFAG